MANTHNHADAVLDNVGAARSRLVGLASACLAFMLFSAQDAVVSHTARLYPPMQVAWLNFTLIGGLVLAWGVGRHGWRGLPAALRTDLPRLHLLRAVLQTVTYALVVLAVAHLPLPLFYTFIFAAPLISNALSGRVLRERAGGRRMAVLLVGFVGLLVALQPDAGALNLYALGALLCAGLLAASQLVTRHIGQREKSSLRLMLFPMAAAFVLLLGPMLAQYQPVRAADLPLLLLTSCLATGGFAFSAQAYQRLPLYLIAPFIYLQFVWGTLAQLFLHGTWPDGRTLLGAALVVASNVAILALQRREEARP